MCFFFGKLYVPVVNFLFHWVVGLFLIDSWGPLLIVRLISCKSIIWSPNSFLSLAFSLVFEVFCSLHTEVRFYIACFFHFSIYGFQILSHGKHLPLSPFHIHIQKLTLLFFSDFLYIFTFKYLLHLAFILLFYKVQIQFSFFFFQMLLNWPNYLKSPLLPPLKCHSIK